MASIIENIRQVMGNTPTFRPSNISTFGDPSLEAGDIVTVTTPEGSETVPLFSLDMDWHGAAETTLSASGNNKRDVQKAGKRADYALESAISSAFGGGGGALQQLEEDLKYDIQQVIASVDDVVSGLVAYVRYDDFQNTYESAAIIFSGKPEYKAMISASYVLDANGQERTMADILADTITLESTKLNSSDFNSENVSGKVSLSGEGVTISGGKIVMNGEVWAKVANVETLIANALQVDKATVTFLDGKQVGCANVVATGPLSAGSGACYLGKDGYASFSGGVSTASLSVGNPGVVFKNCNLKIGNTTATNTFLGTGDITFP